VPFLNGESSVYLVTDKAVTRIGLEDNYVHSYAWSPLSNLLAIVHGSPAAVRTSLYNLESQRVFEFGVNDMTPGGTLRFSANGGRLLLAALIGNNAALSLWNLSSKGTECKQVMTIQARNIFFADFVNATGSLILTATTLPFPEGHGYKIYNDRGGVTLEHDWKNLAGVVVIPPTKPVSTLPAPIPTPAAQAGSAAPAPASTIDIPVSADEIEKKVRAITKKLRQIDPLKEKQRLGQPLEETQLAKIKTEAALQQELDLLEAALAKLK